MSECPSKTSSSFCAYPWMHFANRSDGSVNLCCSDYGKASEKGQPVKLGQESVQEIWNSEYHRQARVDFLSGRRRDECRRCYFEEDMGLESMRQWALRAYENEIEEASRRGVFKKTLEDGGATSESPSQFDLMLGNKCNLECNMCDTVTSSRLNKSMTEVATREAGSAETQKFLKEFYQLTPRDQKAFDWIDNAEVWNDLYARAASIRKICITGGEPTLIPQVPELIRHLLEKSDPSQIDVTTSTNAMVYNPELMTVMNDPRWLGSNLQVSIDGIGETQEYIRYQSRWETVWKNFEKICTHRNINITVNFVLQAYNIENLLPFLSWMSGQGHLIPLHKVTVRFLREPEHLQVLVASDAVKKRVRRQIEENFQRSELEPWREILSIVKNYLDESHDTAKLTQLRREFSEFTRFLEASRKMGDDRRFANLAGSFTAAVAE